MTAAYVQKSAQLFADNSASIAPSLSSVTAGNLVVCNVSSSQNSSTTAIAQPSGWSTAQNPAGQSSGGSYNPATAIFYKENAGSGTQSATITVAASSYSIASISEYSGIATSSALEASNNAGATSGTSGNSGSASNTTADALAIVGISVENGSGVTSLSSPAATGYTVIDTNPDNLVHTPADFSYKILSSAASQSGSWTWTSSAAYVGAIAIFKGGGPPPPTTTNVAGSATAAVGIAETYTFTLDASPAGTVTVTPTAPVAGSWSPTTVGLTSGNWNTGLTSDFTASAAGSGNISSTNDGGLANDTLAVTVYSTSRPSAVTAGSWTDEAGGSLVVADINDASDSTGAKDPAGASYPVLAFTMDTPMAASVSQTCYFRGNNVTAGKQVRQVLFANDGTTVVATGAWKTMTGSLATYSDVLTPTATAYKGEIQTQAA